MLKMFKRKPERRCRNEGAARRRPMHGDTYFIEFSYLLASLLFIYGLRG